VRVQMVEVESDCAGQRIDNFLLARLKGVPKSRIYRILRKGEVRVNRGRIRPDYRLQAGDTVRIPPVRARETQPGRPAEPVLERVAAAILYEDDAWLVVNKPSGLAVHGGSGLSYGLIEALRAMRPRAPFLELGHRLDRDTSGVLVVAKKRSALRLFHQLLRAGEVEKRYLALVAGQWSVGGCRIEAPLLKVAHPSGERIVRVSEQGKAALTLFRPVTIYPRASLLEARLITGRTHQVRVHAAYAGHPIAGDSKYGTQAFNREMAAIGLKRLFLHASHIHFTLPESGREITVDAPLEPALGEVLNRLEGAQ